MTDIYNFPTAPPPVDFEVEDPFEKLAVGRTISTLDDDPQEAARAIELEKSTGVNSSVIHADLEEFEANARAAATAQLVRGNLKISDYLNSHPLAPVVSNGDLSNLDKASYAIKSLPKGFGTLLAAQEVAKALIHFPFDLVDIL